MERIQKLLARSGMGSRREVETWIRDGVIRANGSVATLGAQVSAGDRITVRGYHYLVIEGDNRQRVLVYHKPEGEVVSRNDPQGRPSVFDHLPKLKNSRWVAVGRLDFNTSGVLLLTSDGELANALTHPSSGLEREYAVRIFGQASNQQLQALRDGVELEDGLACFDDIVDRGGQGRNHWYHVILREGRNREVRRLWASQELTVSRLARVRFGPVLLPRWLKPGKWHDMNSGHLSSLKAELGLKSDKQLVLKASKPGRGRKSR